MAQLLEKIKDIHINYLEAETEDKQDEIYLHLRGEIVNYLSQENLTMKFTIREFADLLEYNIENRSDFSLIGTSQAFDALEKYANNLLLFSWRNEFRMIKMYGGFYKHKIAKHLYGVEKIFQLMGYKQLDDYTLITIESIQSVKMAEIALNCIIASCECTLIHDFYQVTIDAGCRCGYKEVYKLRKGVTEKTSAYRNNIAKPSSQFSNGINGDYKYRNTTKKNTINPEDLYEQVRKPNRQNSEQKKPMLPTRGKTRDFLKPETHDRHIEASISAVNDLAPSTRSSTLQPETRADTWDYVDKTLPHQYETAAKPKLPVEDDDDDIIAYRHQHKASQLLEGFRRPQSDGDIIGNRSSNLVYTYPPPYPQYILMPHPLTAIMPCSPPPGYGCRDNLDPKMYPMMGDSQLQRMNGNHVDVKGRHESGNSLAEQRSQRSSFYDNMPPDYVHDQAKQWNKVVNSSKLPDNFNYADPMPSPPSPFNKDEGFLIEIDGCTRQSVENESKKGKTKRQGVKEKIPMNSQSKESRNEERRSSSSGSSSVLSIDEDQWQCPSCTMLNKSSDKICYMCSRSRVRGPEAIPLQSGGKECAQCTYINDANALTCSVCDMRLSHEITSTYV